MVVLIVLSSEGSDFGIFICEYIKQVTAVPVESSQRCRITQAAEAYGFSVKAFLIRVLHFDFHVRGPLYDDSVRVVLLPW